MGQVLRSVTGEFAGPASEPGAMARAAGGSASLTAWEAERLRAVRRYNVLDTAPEEAFDRITQLARAALGTSVLFMSVIDDERVWLKSAQGLAARPIPLEHAMCRWVIQTGKPLVVDDCSQDERFRDNPFVTGAPNIRFYMSAPLHTWDGFNIGTVCAIDGSPQQPTPDQLGLLQVAASMVMHELELRLLACTDVLTGAASRAVFTQQAEQTILAARRSGEPVSLLGLDVDHFKRINDQHGHAAGDRVLKELVACCRAVLRGSDMLGRLGGEEFGILLPNTACADAQAIAEDVRLAIGRLALSVPSGSMAVTASVGVASLGPRVQSYEQLSAAADHALYAAKAGGRNMVAVG